ncbi:hypothetical protein SA231_05000 [Staphylococcus aureus]|nr:hypothetical protein SA231_05000 [Staphylococcus aureus]
MKNKIITIKFICSKQFFVIGVNIKNGVSIKNIRWRNDDSFKEINARYMFGITHYIDWRLCHYDKNKWSKRSN